MLHFIKQQAPRNRRTGSKTLICLQLINCPASRLTLPPRLSTRGRETGSNQGSECQRVIVKCSHIAFGIITFLGEMPNTLPPPPSFSLLFWWTGIKMRGIWCLFVFQLDAPALTLSGMLTDADILPTPYMLACEALRSLLAANTSFLLKVMPLQSCLAMYFSTERTHNSLFILLLFI